MSDMEVAVTIDRFVFEVRHELERYGYCRLGEVGTLRIEPEKGVLKLYPPVKSEEVLPEVQAPYVPAPILDNEEAALDVEPMAQEANVAESAENLGVEQSIGVEAASLLDNPVSQQDENLWQPEPEIVQPEVEAVQPEVEMPQSEENLWQPEPETVQPEVEAVQPEEKTAQTEKVETKAKDESSAEPILLNPQSKKTKRRIKFDLVMLIAVAAILAAIALIALGIYNVSSSGGSDDVADDRAMNKVRVPVE
jgi:hypothetical protein